MMDLIVENPIYLLYAVGALLVVVLVVAQVAAAFTKGDEDDKALAGVWQRLIGPVLKLFGRGGAVIIFALLVPGCAMQITGEGLQASLGQATATTCGSVSGESDAALAEDCATANGGTVSEQGTKLLQPLFSLLGGIGKLLMGAGGA